jgi:hypothetical protein
MWNGGFGMGEVGGEKGQVVGIPGGLDSFP